MQQSVFVTVPNEGWVHKQVVGVIMRLQQDPRYKLRTILPTHRPYENNLHHCRKDFLSGGEDFWLSIDSDNPPFENPLNLVELHLDLVGLPTPVWHYLEKYAERPIYWNGYDYVSESDAYKEHMPQKGLQRVDAIGTGCFLVSRRLMLAMDEAPFSRKLHKDGTVDKGNDLSFCERVRDKGFEIWAHYDYPCRHFHEIELTSIIGAIHDSKEASV